MYAKNIFRLVVFSMLMFVLITGCVAGAGDTSAAALEAQSWLADRLNVSAGEVKIVSLEQVDWTDSCFGLGGPAESCAAEITPGWKIVFEVGGAGV